MMIHAVKEIGNSLIWFSDSITRGFGWALSILGIVAGLSILSWVFPSPFDATDNAIAGLRSGMNVMTDHETGCQYLSTLAGITPRLGRDGMQICD